MAQTPFYFQLKNNTGSTIMNAFVTHATEDYPVTTASASQLKPGGSSGIVEGFTGPSSRDYWYIGWTTDGQNYVTFMGRNAVNDHGTSNDPALITLNGTLGSSNLSITFQTDGGSTDTGDITNPW